MASIVAALRVLVPLPPLLLLLLTAIAVVPPVGGTCQMLWPPHDREQCGCDNLRVSVYILHCERRGLRALPAAAPSNVSDPRHVVVANFSGNSISAVDARFFRGGSLPLVALDLSHNAIGELPADALAGVGARLRALNVSHNRLRRVHPGALPPQLEELDLGSNELSEPCALPLAEARRVSLVRNGVRRLGADCFASAGSLDSNRVEVLDLGHNAIDHVAPGAFRSAALLKTLVLDGNRLGGGGGDGGGLLPAIEPLEALATLSLRANALTSLDALCSSPLPPSLRSLDLGANGLELVPPYCFKRYFGRTEELALRLDGNRLSAIDENTFGGLELRLRSLDLSRNAIASVGAAAFEKMSALRSLDLSRNAVASLAFLCRWRADSLESLSVAGNRLRALPAAFGCFGNKRLLRSLDLSGNRLLSVGAEAFVGLGRLERLDLSDNDVTSVSERAFAGLPELRRLRLSGNALVYLRRCAFERRLGGLVEFHYDVNPLHCDCDLHWLKAYTAAISERGMREDSVRAPVRHAACGSVALDLVPPGSGSGGARSSLIDAVSACSAEPTAVEQCIGLSLVAVDVRLNASGGAAALNLTWQLAVPRDAAGASSLDGGAPAAPESAGAAVSEGSSLSLEASLVDIATGDKRALGEWRGRYDGTSAGHGLSASAPLQAEGVYKVCVRMSVDGGKRAQSDCAVYPPDLQKPTAAPSAGVASSAQDDDALHPGAVASIVLAVILVLCIAATVVIVYFAYKKWHSYQPRKEDELAGREKTGGGRRSPYKVSDSAGESDELSPIKTADV